MVTDTVTIIALEGVSPLTESVMAWIMQVLAESRILELYLAAYQR